MARERGAVVLPHEPELLHAPCCRMETLPSRRKYLLRRYNFLARPPRVEAPSTSPWPYVESTIGDGWKPHERQCGRSMSSSLTRRESVSFRGKPSGRLPGLCRTRRRD